MSLDADTRARDGFKCTYCGRELRWGTSEIDHVKPVSQGGSDELDNLRAACVRCNQSKSGSTPNEWFGSPEERAWSQFYSALMTPTPVSDQTGEGWVQQGNAEKAAVLADEMLAEWRERWRP